MGHQRRNFSRRDFLKSGLGGAVLLLPGVSSALPFGLGFLRKRQWTTGVADVWTATSTASAPSARGNHAAVWTGSEMLVWGGQNGGTYLSSGGRFNPGGNSWTAMSTGSAPAGRNGHTMIWTGSEAIVWGGYTGSVVQTGGRYSPSTNTWTATATGSAPSARTNHCAVWTGSEMLIWGGQNGSGSTIHGTGGRYNPSTNTWASISTVGAPAARTNPRAVWTGSEMIVFGGNDTSSVLQSGGIYDPVTDTWETLTITGAPSARAKHWIAWTGSEMIVWGGDIGSSSDTNTGGRYSRASDSWSPTAATTLAIRRDPLANAESSWTGSALIVWGGANAAGTRLRTGAFYNPQFNGWKEMTLTGAPTARRGHTVIWTGSQVIVWGGNDGSDVNTGGIYG